MNVSMHNKLCIVAVSVFVFALAGCDSLASTVAVTAPVHSVAITPGEISVELGGVISFAAVALDAQGRELSGRVFRWSTSDASIVPVNIANAAAGQVVSGTRRGVATIQVESEGRTASAKVTVMWTPNHSQSGVRVLYYALPIPTVQLPDFGRLTPFAGELVPNIDFPVTGGPFAGSGRPGHVGARFDGLIDIPDSGEWQFFLESDDGSRLWIGDELVVDNDGLHPMTEKRGVITLGAGEHPFRLDYFDNDGGRGLIFRYAGPGISKRVVPPEVLLHAPKISAGLESPVLFRSRRWDGIVPDATALAYFAMADSLMQRSPTTGYCDRWITSLRAVSNQLVCEGGAGRDVVYDISATLDADFADSGLWFIRVGADAGRGAAWSFNGLPKGFTANDVYSDSVFEGQITILPGVNQLRIVAIEPCCDGPVSWSMSRDRSTWLDVPPSPVFVGEGK